MPVLPSRSLKKYSSLSTESPDPVEKIKVSHTLSAPVTGNRIVNALLHFRRRSEETSQPDANCCAEFSDSFDNESKVESSRMMQTPKKNRSNSPSDPDRPHLAPYFQKKNNSKELVSSFEDKHRTETERDDYLNLGTKRPTLNPFFNANHHFMRALRRMGSKDSFSRLKPGRDD